MLLREVQTGTEIAIVHIDIPEGQGARYQSGWVEHYFDLMRDYFARGGAAAAKPATPAKMPAKAVPKAKAKPKKSAPKKAAPAAKKKSAPKKSARKAVKAKSVAKKKVA